MDNNKEVQYDFCSKCGAMVRDGVCSSCGTGNVVEAAAVPVVETVATEPVSPVDKAQFTNQDQNNNPYANTAQNNVVSNPYGAYQNYTAYNNGAIPADVPAKKHNGKVWAIIGVCIGIVVLLLVLLGIAVGRLVAKIDEAASTYSGSIWDDDNYGNDYNYDDDYDYDYDDDYSYDDYYEDDYYYEEEYNDDEPIISPDGKTYGYSPEDDYYYQLNDNIREDLSYSVYFEEAEYTDGDNAYVHCIYPVLEGDIPNIDYLNDVIYSEYTYFVDYYIEHRKSNVQEYGYYYSLSEAYVTYMDEKIISIVFDEDYTGDDHSVLYLECINIDVENGVIINNTEIIDANDDFVTEFRTRDAAQNQSDALDYYTDQELKELLNLDVSLIVFYTPLGLEVGIVHDFGWSTATFKDYENYLKQF